MKFVKGDYVRMPIAPDTRMGTIEGHKIERGVTSYVFRQDPRLKEVGPAVEIWVSEDEVEACARPTDAYWNTVNELIKRG